MAGAARTNLAGALLLSIAVLTGVLIGVHGPSTSPVSPGAPPVPVLAGLADRIGGAVGDTAFADRHGGPR